MLPWPLWRTSPESEGPAQTSTSESLGLSTYSWGTTGIFFKIIVDSKELVGECRSFPRQRRQWPIKGELRPREESGDPRRARWKVDPVRISGILLGPS